MVSGLRICIRTRISSSWHGFLFNFSRYGQVALHRDWIIPRITSKMHWAFCEFQVCVNPRYCQSFPWSSFLCDAISWFSLPNTLHPFHILAPRNWNYCFHFTDEETEVETRQFFFQDYTANQWKREDLYADYLAPESTSYIFYYTMGMPVRDKHMAVLQTSEEELPALFAALAFSKGTRIYLITWDTNHCIISRVL